MASVPNDKVTFMFQTLDNLEAELHGLVKAIDPHALAPADAADAVHALAVIARIATAGVTKLTARAAECRRWEKQGSGDVGTWVAGELGIDVRDGRSLAEASTRLDLCPDTWQLMTGGTTAPLKGAEIIASAAATEKARAAARARAEAAEQQRRRSEADAARAGEREGDDEGDDDDSESPVDLGKTVEDVERDLLDLANTPTGTLRRLRDERQKAEASARDEVQDAIYGFLHRSLTYSHGADGMANAHLRLSNDLMAAVRAILEAKATALFRLGGRGANGKAPTHANLLADALLVTLTGRLPTHPHGTTPGPTRKTKPTTEGPRRGRTATSGPPPERRPKPKAGPEAGPDGQAKGHPAHQPDSAADAQSDATQPAWPAPAAGHGSPPATAGVPATDPELPLVLGDGTDVAADPVAHDEAALVGPVGEAVVRVHAAALARGLVLPGEACEIVGTGPISLGHARHLAQHACIDVVLSDATGVTTVAPTGRRLARRLDLGPPQPPPPHRTRLVLLIDNDRIRGPGHPLELPGTGPVSRDLLARLVPDRAIHTIAACAVDPDSIDTDGRTYPRPLAVAIREAHPVCPSCGFDRWQQTDHVLARALGGRTTRANLARPCTWCHAAKTRAEAPATIRAGRRRTATDTSAKPRKRRRRRRPTPADNP